MTRTLLFVLAFCAPLCPLGSSAQDASVSTEQTAADEARRLFELGRDKLQAGQAAAAVDDFRRSLALVDRSATRFNFAIALCGSGQYVEGIEQYERLLRTTDLEPDKRNEVIQKKAEAETRLSRIALTNGAQEEMAVFVDGLERGSLAPDKTLVLAVNPGSHNVFARSSRGNSSTRRLTTHSGQTESHTFVLAGASAAAGSEQQAPNPLLESAPSSGPRDDQDAESAPVWPWIVVGVLAAGGVAVTAVLLSGSGEDDNFDARAETLSFRF